VPPTRAADDGDRQAYNKHKASATNDKTANICSLITRITQINVFFLMKTAK